MKDGESKVWHEGPPPGAPAALQQGCRCPVIDNHYGRGTPFGYVVNGDCPLHGLKAQGFIELDVETGEPVEPDA